MNIVYRQRVAFDKRDGKFHDVAKKIVGRFVERTVIRDRQYKIIVGEWTGDNGWHGFKINVFIEKWSNRT